ncbi:hypothetical protein [Helicobacter sp. T3_23-1059]
MTKQKSPNFPLPLRRILLFCFPYIAESQISYSPLPSLSTSVASGWISLDSASAIANEC